MAGRVQCLFWVNRAPERHSLGWFRLLSLCGREDLAVGDRDLALCYRPRRDGSAATDRDAQNI